MDLTDLTMELSHFGHVQICHANTVFTLLMTGHDLDNAKTYCSIQTKVLNQVGDHFPYIEAMRNDTNFFA